MRNTVEKNSLRLQLEDCLLPTMRKTSTYRTVSVTVMDVMLERNLICLYWTQLSDYNMIVSLWNHNLGDCMSPQIDLKDETSLDKKKIEYLHLYIYHFGNFMQINSSKSPCKNALVIHLISEAINHSNNNIHISHFGSFCHMSKSFPKIHTMHLFVAKYFIPLSGAIRLYLVLRSHLQHMTFLSIGKVITFNVLLVYKVLSSVFISLTQFLCFLPLGKMCDLQLERGRK